MTDPHLESERQLRDWQERCAAAEQRVAVLAEALERIAVPMAGLGNLSWALIANERQKIARAALAPAIERTTA